MESGAWRHRLAKMESNSFKVYTSSSAALPVEHIFRKSRDVQSSTSSKSETRHTFQTFRPISRKVSKFSPRLTYPHEFHPVSRHVVPFCFYLLRTNTMYWCEAQAQRYRLSRTSCLQICPYSLAYPSSHLLSSAFQSTSSFQSVSLRSHDNFWS